jgi:transcriptional regulator with XRE-family HTH domain
MIYTILGQIFVIGDELRFEDAISDAATLQELGHRVEAARLDRNMTQAQLAEQAGIGKSTVERLEAGRAPQLANFLRVLRVLNLLEALDRVLPERHISPIEQMKLAGHRRRRASRQRPAQARPWQWGDKP